MANPHCDNINGSISSQENIHTLNISLQWTHFQRIQGAHFLPFIPEHIINTVLGVEKVEASYIIYDSKNDFRVKVVTLNKWQVNMGNVFNINNKPF